MRKTLKLLAVLFAIAAAIGINRTTLAYFQEGVVGSQYTTQETLNVGTWTGIYSWSPTAVYKHGDIVTWNGKTCRSGRLFVMNLLLLECKLF